jgi:hypothetical protein
LYSKIVFSLAFFIFSALSKAMETTKTANKHMQKMNEIQGLILQVNLATIEVKREQMMTFVRVFI